MAAPDAQPPTVFWSPSQGWLWPDADGLITSLDMGELATWGRNLPADAVRLVPADALKRAERRAGHCNGRELDPPCGYCESVRQCERCELTAASKPWLRPSAALAGTTTPTADEIREEAASRLRAMAPNHRTAIAGVLNGIADWMSYAGLHDDVAEKQRALSSARALLASTPTEETDHAG